MLQTPRPEPVLPSDARLPINRCNLPPDVIGGLRFQEHPAPLEIDGVAVLHAELFAMLDGLETAAERAERFMDYMTVHFCLRDLEEAGLAPSSSSPQARHPRESGDPEKPAERPQASRDSRFRGNDDGGGSKRRGRAKADYLRMLRGWSFDPDGREAAVLKSWVESRFGLLPRFHGAPLRDFNSEAYDLYLAARSQGLYNTNALESQLDLVYAYRQYEYVATGEAGHLTLYRGINSLDTHDVLARPTKTEALVLLNNLNSFTTERERAEEFGDLIMTAEVPTAKVFCTSDLLPVRLRGEKEVMVIGGVYGIELSYY